MAFHGGRTRSFPSNLWWCFLGLVAGGSILSYTHPSPLLGLGAGVVGIGVPIIFLLLARYPSPDPDSLPPVAPWVWILLGVGALAARLYHWGTLSTWPLMDEGVFGYFAVELSEKWRWDLFYSYTQFPPFFYWGLGLFFKAFGPSLQSLWLFPTLLSILTIPLAYTACRSFFSTFISFIFTGLWAFGFAPLFIGRLCLAQVLLILWQFLVVMALGNYLASRPRGGPQGSAILLGTLVGLGFYIYLHWPVMALFTGLVVLAQGSREPRFPKDRLSWFFITSVLSAAPMVLATLNHSHGSYWSSLSAFQHHFPWEEQAKVCWRYLETLFWGTHNPRFAYTPVWGGFLNPIAGALAVVGLVALLKDHRMVNQVLLAGMILFCLPAFLTNDVEMLRLVLVLPPILLAGAYGAQALAASLPLSWKLPAVIGLLALSAGLDLYHGLVLYPQAWKDPARWSPNPKPLDRFKAFEILSSMARQQGPGLILTEFESTPFEKTLVTAVYPFNAARNPGLSPEKASWAGVLTNINYAPFLSRRFPDSRWFPLSDNPESMLALGLIPLRPGSRKALEGWLGMEAALRPLTFRQLQLPFGRQSPELLEDLLALRPRAAKDPFLGSCLSERIYFTAMSLEKPAEALTALRQALTGGYPAAHLYNDLGVFWFDRGENAQARRCFQAALKCPFNRTNALDNLRRTPSP